MPACEHSWSPTTYTCTKCGVSMAHHKSLSEAEQLREALRFYAYRSNWGRAEKAYTVNTPTGIAVGRWSAVELDGGERARKALGERE